MEAAKSFVSVPSWPYSEAAGMLRSALQAATFGMLDLVAPAEVEGEQVFGTLRGPALLAANHTSHLDTPAVLRALPRDFRRRVAVAAAGDYFFANPWAGAAVALYLNAFPFSRACSAGAVRTGLQYCADLID